MCKDTELEVTGYIDKINDNHFVVYFSSIDVRDLIRMEDFFDKNNNCYDILWFTEGMAIHIFSTFKIDQLIEILCESNFYVNVSKFDDREKIYIYRDVSKVTI